MSTRGCIARATGDGFQGRYHHWDSYPNGLGRSLWYLYRTYFKYDLNRMLKTLIDEHPAGWSTIVDKDFRLPPGWVNVTGTEADDSPVRRARPQCFCHGERHENAQLVTMKNASGAGIEWVYAFNQKNQMLVLASFVREKTGTKMIGIAGMGAPDAVWKIMATIALDNEDEPDWKGIENRAYGNPLRFRRRRMRW